MTSSEEVDDRRQRRDVMSVNTLVDNDCQFKLDAFRCMQPVKTGKSVGDVV